MGLHRLQAYEAGLSNIPHLNSQLSVSSPYFILTLIKGKLMKGKFGFWMFYPDQFRVQALKSDFLSGNLMPALLDSKHVSLGN